MIVCASDDATTCNNKRLGKVTPVKSDWNSVQYLRLLQDAIGN